MNIQFIFLAVVQVFSAGVFTGGLFLSVKFLEEQIKRLEKKQDKHNNLIERMVVVEQSTKSAHHRLDNIKKR